MTIVDESPSTRPDDWAGDLQPAARTAERELERQQRIAGQGPITGLVSGGAAKFRALGGADAARRGLRYRPVIWSVIVIVAVAFFLPGRDDASSPVAAQTTVPFIPATTPPTTSPTSAPPTTIAPADVAPPTTVLRPVPTTQASPSPTPIPTAPTPTTTTTTSPPAPTPLQIVAHGWATSASGVPIGATAVPEGSLPVANRLGQLDKVSFFRLSGSETVLTIDEDVDGAREAVGSATVKLCPATSGWSEGPEQSMDDAPTWSDQCVVGSESENTWTFDLGALGDPTVPNGFVLVPADDAPADFQVTFEP